MALLDLQLDEFLEQVASADKTPGSGSVAALVTAAAAGLLAKVARASTESWDEARTAAAQAQALCDRVTPLADLAAEAYEAALDAREYGYDDFELGRAFAAAAEPPMQIVETATDVALLSVVVARCCDPSLRPDAIAAAALAVGAARAAAELVAANLTASATDDRVLRVRAFVAEAADAAEHALVEH
jgi:formiminotetrahydrofolate cyclodeaminase